MDNTITPIGPEVLEDLQAKYPGGSLIEFEDGHWAFFRKPTRAAIGLAMTKARTNPLELVDVLVRNCMVDQSKGLDLSTDEGIGYLMGLAEKVDAIIGTKKAELKNS